MVVSSRRDTYTHTLHELLLAAEYSAHGHVRCECSPIFHLHAIKVSPYFLVKRITNSYDTQRPTLDNAIILLIAYRLVTNIFRDLTTNPLLSINNSPKDFITTQEFKIDQFVIKILNNFY